MPTKPNKAGQQQNYVPAGNGDASGEYGDNESGSNIHFTNFKKPQESVKVEKKEELPTPVEKPIEEPKKEYVKSKKILDELSKTPKQKKDIINYIYGRKNKDANITLENLRYYTGSFGALGKYNDDEVKELIEYINLQNFERSNEPVYVKKGSKWMLTYEKQAYEFTGIKTYTKEEKEQLESSKNQKLIESSQNKYDKNIQSTLGKTIVCFGKGYKDEDLVEIETATKNLVNDFDGLKNFVSAMGDRNNLEKYLNARRAETQLTEEQVNAEMQRISKYTIFYGDNKQERLRQQAIKNLTGNINITRYQSAYAYWDSGSNMMIFMPKMKDAAESLKRDYNANFHPTDKVISVYYHEMGHATDYMVRKEADEIQNILKSSRITFEQYSEFNKINAEFRNQLNDLVNQNYNGKTFNQEIVNKYNKQFGTNFKSWEELNKGYDREKSFRISMLEQMVKNNGIKKYNVSEYANTNQKEFIAECFAGHYCNAGNEICEKTFNLVKDYYKKLKEFRNGL